MRTMQVLWTTAAKENSWIAWTQNAKAFTLANDLVDLEGKMSFCLPKAKFLLVYHRMEGTHTCPGVPKAHP